VCGRKPEEIISSFAFAPDPKSTVRFSVPLFDSRRGKSLPVRSLKNVSQCRTRLFSMAQIAWRHIQNVSQYEPSSPCKIAYSWTRVQLNCLEPSILRVCCVGAWDVRV
jgi:hypothetical protein